MIETVAHTSEVSDTSGILWLVLDSESRRMLSDTYQGLHKRSDDNTTLLYHHATLLYGVDQADPLVTDYLDQPKKIEAYSHVHNDVVEAVRIRSYGVQNPLPDTTYGVPHITISVAGDTRPKASVDMLQSPQDQYEERLIKPLLLSGIIEFCLFSKR